jgi:hypothetical protein
MIDLAATISAMQGAGMTSDEIVRSLACVQIGAQPAAAILDEQAERRRARDRDRKRLRNSAEFCGNGGTVPPSPKETSPTPPKEITPSTPSTPKENPLRGQKKAVRLPEDWVLRPEWRQDAIDAGLSENLIDLEAAKMRDWSRSSKNGAKLDWRATWRNWCREAAARTPQQRAGPSLNRPPTAQELLKARRQEISLDEPPPNRPLLVASR